MSTPETNPKAAKRGPIKTFIAHPPAAQPSTPEKAALSRESALDPRVIPKGFTYTPSAKPVEDIIAERCVFAPGNVSVAINPDTPLEEVIPMLGYFEGVREHVGFYIGDVLVFAEDKFKETLEWALMKCGKAAPTLRNYAWIARSFPPAMRSEGLSFGHYKQLAPALKLAEKAQVVALLREAKGTKTKAPMTREELGRAVKERFPKPPPKPKKGSSAGKQTKKPVKRKEPIYHKMGPHELAAADDLFERLEMVNGILKTKIEGKTWVDLYLSVSPEEKRALVNALRESAELHKRVTFKLGYA